MSEAYLLSLHRRTATCSCTDEGPGTSCISGQQLFELVRQTYSRACHAHPRDNIPWSLYETRRAYYYAHLGEMAPDLDRMLQKAVNTISNLLINLADADDDRNPESGEIYSDVIQGALYLDDAIKIGIIPDNYGMNIANLIEEAKNAYS